MAVRRAKRPSVAKGEIELNLLLAAFDEPALAPLDSAAFDAFLGSRAVIVTLWPARVSAVASAVPTLPAPMIATFIAMFLRTARAPSSGVRCFCNHTRCFILVSISFW